MDHIESLLDTLRMVRRRFALIAVVGGLGVLASAFAAYILPPVYQSEARILVESQQIPDELARSTVTASASKRLELIRQRLMVRKNLQKLIEELDLFSDRSDLTLNKKIEQLGNAVVFVPFTTPGENFGPGVLSSFAIQVTLNDPIQAARVANEFGHIVLEQNAQVRTKRAADTLAFFERQADGLGAQITALEEKISAYKLANEDALPDGLEYRRDELSRLDERDLSLNRRILDLQAQRGILTARLNEAQLGLSDSEESPQRQRLRQLEGELAQLRTVYTDSHRQIRAILAEIAKLRAEMPSDGTDGEKSIRDVKVEGLQKQITLIDNQIDLSRNERAKVAGRREALHESIQRTPEVEARLSALERRHEDLQDQLSAIKGKRAEAETGEKLEISEQAERFEFIENAAVPDSPISPNRKKIAIMGSGASIALALGLALLIEMLWPAIRTASQMQRQLDLRPVVAIPHIWTRRERRLRYLKGITLMLILGAGVPAALYAVDQSVMPLQQIGTKVVDKTGLSEFIRIVEARW